MTFIELSRGPSDWLAPQSQRVAARIPYIRRAIGNARMLLMLWSVGLLVTAAACWTCVLGLTWLIAALIGLTMSVSLWYSGNAVMCSMVQGRYPCRFWSGILLLVGLHVCFARMLFLVLCVDYLMLNPANGMADPPTGLWGLLAWCVVPQPMYGAQWAAGCLVFGIGLLPVYALLRSPLRLLQRASSLYA